MLTIGGLVFLLLCVFGSYIMSGGSLEPLIEAMPFELLTIGGAAIGTFIMGNSMHDVKHTIGGFKKILKGATFKKSHYVDLLSLMFFFTRLATSKGTMASASLTTWSPCATGTRSVTPSPRTDSGSPDSPMSRTWWARRARQGCGSSSSSPERRWH